MADTFWTLATSADAGWEALYPCCLIELPFRRARAGETGLRGADRRSNPQPPPRPIRPAGGRRTNWKELPCPEAQHQTARTPILVDMDGGHPAAAGCWWMSSA